MSKPTHWPHWSDKSAPQVPIRAPECGAEVQEIRAEKPAVGDVWSRIIGKDSCGDPIYEAPRRWSGQGWVLI